LRSLLVDGVIAGVGSVLVFLPQIFALFFFIAVLEDCGYMARAAYLMDKIMSRVGLSGKSFIPLLSSFACAIPGIMATRVIENRRDRLVTVLIAPLMSCSARLPVYTLMAAAFLPGSRLLQGVTIFAMYILGIVAAIVVALALKRTILKGTAPAFVMELPSYKVPGLWIVLHRMLQQGWSFVYRAGTLIFAVTVVVWFLAYYPRDPASVDPTLHAEKASLESQIAKRQESVTNLDTAAREELEEAKSKLADVKNRIEGAYLESSFLGRAGHFIEPAVRPLGWDWRIGCAAIASFPAREVVVATLGTIYNLGQSEDAQSLTLQRTLQEATWRGTDRPVFNVPVALSIMVFFALCAQCASTLAVMKRETNSWLWPAFTFVYMTSLAYLGALVTYQVGMWIVGYFP
jgi:ferrous iron transport protein B